MSLDEAIEHCKKKSCGNNACALEHKQLEKWLTELKELKGKNPAWSKEDEKFFRTALWHISYSVSNGKSTDCHCGTTDWLKSLKGRVQLQPKWSEEDKEHLESVVHRTEVYGGCNLFGKVKEDFEWLKDLPNRIHLQPKQEWGEEDELMLTSIIQTLKLTNGAAQMKIDWLKSLKERYTWKPTKVQLRALLFVIGYLTFTNPEIKTKIETLYNDLKKLM